MRETISLSVNLRSTRMLKCSGVASLHSRAMLAKIIREILYFFQDASIQIRNFSNKCVVHMEIASCFWVKTFLFWCARSQDLFAEASTWDIFRFSYATVPTSCTHPQADEVEPTAIESLTQGLDEWAIDFFATGKCGWKVNFMRFTITREREKIIMCHHYFAVSFSLFLRFPTRWFCFSWFFLGMTFFPLSRCVLNCVVKQVYCKHLFIDPRVCITITAICLKTHKRAYPKETSDCDMQFESLKKNVYLLFTWLDIRFTCRRIQY